MKTVVIESFFATWALMKAGRMNPGNILSLVFLFLCCYAFKQIRNRFIQNAPFRMKLTAAALSVLFVLMYMLVDYKNYIQDFANGFFRLIILLAVFTGFVILIYHILIALFSYTSVNGIVTRLFFKKSEQENRTVSFIMKHIFLFSFLICLLCWMPYFLYEYPGIMTPDSINQYEQALGVIPYSNHHPWVHTMLIKLLYNIGSIFSSDIVVRVSFYTLFQMSVMALAAAYTVATMARCKAKPAVCFISLIFYALVPYNAVYAVTVWKDVLFAGGVLIFTTALFRLIFISNDEAADCSVEPEKLSNIDCSVEPEKLSNTDYIIESEKLSNADCSVESKKFNFDYLTFFVSGLMVCLLRSNGWYAFLIATPFLLFSFRKRWKPMWLLQIGIIAIALFIKGPVMTAESVTQPDFVEAVSIPLQQMAAVICNDGDLTDEQWSEVGNVIDTTYIKELYNPEYADNIKELVRAGHPEYLEQHKMEYLKLWLELGISHPATYASAYINSTYGYWFPDSSYTVADTDGISDNALGLSSRPLIGGKLVIKVKEIAIKLGSLIPVYGTIWCMGAVLWIFLLCIGVSIVRRENGKLICYLLSFAVFATVMIATPVAYDFRYAYYMVLTLPMYIFICIVHPLQKIV